MEKVRLDAKQVETAIARLAATAAFHYVPRPPVGSEEPDAQPWSYEEERDWTVRTWARAMKALGVDEGQREAAIRNWNAQIAQPIADAPLREILDRVELNDVPVMINRDSWERMTANLGVTISSPWFVEVPGIFLRRLWSSWRSLVTEKSKVDAENDLDELKKRRKKRKRTKDMDKTM
ncbi:hypothetical protein GTO91_15990 [Heliobacterium undosum]|uniref:Uncharacterized protein n=1 Tax=Heliomicrobium undosum TaxID=121734 RepID=A0A845L7F4_9FIRM|nr:hypothetical protein [Heliomicrobium undosum]MZP31209.1 hypothetical protein [Heliomicrobium undosum]